MVKKSPWYMYVAAYLLWLLAMALGLWLLLRARATYPVLIGVLSNETEFNTRQIAMFADRAVVFLFGLAWLIMMVVSEHFFRTGIKRGRVWRYGARIIGILLLLIGVTDAADILGVSAGLPVPTARWVLMIAELVGGAALLWYGGRKLARPARTETPYELKQ